MKANQHPFTVSGWNARGIALTDQFPQPITVQWEKDNQSSWRKYSSLDKIPVTTTGQGKPAYCEVEGKRHLLFPVVIGLSPGARKLLSVLHKENMTTGEGATCASLAQAEGYSKALGRSRHKVVWMISSEPVEDTSHRENPLRRRVVARSRSEDRAHLIAEIVAGVLDKMSS